MLFLRSISAAIFLLILSNKKAGFYLYSGIPKQHVPLMILRIAIGIVFLACIYTSAKYLPLVIVALCQNLSPLLTAVLSYFFIKKGLTYLDTAVLIVSFGGVVLLITGSL